MPPSEEDVELALHTFLAEHAEALSTALAEVQANGTGRGADVEDYAVTGVTGFAAAGEPLDRGVVVHTRRVDIHLVIKVRPTTS